MTRVSDFGDPGDFVFVFSFSFVSSQKNHKTKKILFEFCFTQFSKIKFGLAFHFFKNESATLETELCLSFTSGNRHKQGFASFSQQRTFSKTKRKMRSIRQRKDRSFESLDCYLGSTQPDPKMCLGGVPKTEVLVRGVPLITRTKSRLDPLFGDPFGIKSVNY